MNYRSFWRRKEFTYLLLALALTVFAIAPLTYPGYMQVHSGFIPVYNLADLADGPPHLNWTPSVATRFDPLRSDGLLPYYLAMPVLWLGGEPLTGVKLLHVLGFLLGAVGVYLWLRRPLGGAGAALAALVYTYLPYHLAVVYVRGAWGEALFWGLLPWAVWAVADEARLRPYRRTIPAVPVWTLLGLSQPGLTIWAFLLLLIGWLLGHVGKGEAKPHLYKMILPALGGMAVALTLTLLAVGFTFSPSPIDFFDHFLYPSQLFSPYWGFGASRPGWDDGLALGVGFAALGLGMLTLFLHYDRRRKNSGELNWSHSLIRPLPLLTLSLLSALLLFSPSAFLWRVTGLYHTLTYPWQLLGFIGLCLSVLAGMLVKLDERLTRLSVYAVLTILTLLASYAYLEPRFTQYLPGTGPLATWDGGRLMLLDREFSVEIPPSAAGLSEPTPRRLPLRDYGPPRPGDTLHLTLTWQATRPFYRDLKLFVHLLDSSGQLVTQTDPLAGASTGPDGEDYLTGQWNPGELIRDDVVLVIPPDASPSPYRLALGLYDGDTLERLSVVDQDDAMVVLEVGSSEVAK